MAAESLLSTVISGASAGKWSDCDGDEFEDGVDHDQPTDEAIAVATAAANGDVPAWFTTKYSSGSIWDYDQIWADVINIDSRLDRVSAAFSLGDHFGGYCSAATVNEQVTAGPTTADLANPWKDGGCTE